MSTTNRRGLLGAFLPAAATLAAVALPTITLPASRAAENASPDAEIFARCAAVNETQRKLEVVDRCGATEAECNRAIDKHDLALTNLAQSRATTPAGVRAKAATIFASMVYQDGDIDRPAEETAAMSVLRDLLMLSEEMKGRPAA